MKIVIVGAGEVGSTIAGSLADSHDVVVVDVDSDRVETLNYSADVLATTGDGTEISTLEEANVGNSDILIASTDDDETNIVTCGTAKTLGDTFTIARVKNTKFLETWDRSEAAFGVDFMVGTNLLTAQTAVRVLGLPYARDVDTFAGGRVQMAEFEIPEKSPVAGQTVQEADRFDSLTFAALLRDEDVIIPSGQTVIKSGDEVVVIGSQESVRQLAAEVAPHASGASDVLIVGGSDIGYQIARQLEDQGLSPRLIERNAERARDLAEKLPATTVLESDATDREFLVREHIGEVDAVVAALGSDEKNLLAALLAKRLGASRTVTVVENSEYVDLFEEVGVDIAVNPRKSTAEEITRFTRERRAKKVALIESDIAEVIEFEVTAGSPLADCPISESVSELPEGVVFGAVSRNGGFVAPRGDTVIQAGDTIVVFVETEVIDELIANI